MEFLDHVEYVEKQQDKRNPEATHRHGVERSTATVNFVRRCNDANETN